MSDKPPPDFQMFVSPTQPGNPVEIAHAEYAHFTATALSVRLIEGSPPGTAEALREKLADAFPQLTVAVIG